MSDSNIPDFTSMSKSDPEIVGGGDEENENTPTAIDGELDAVDTDSDVVPLDDVDETWTRYFPYETAYAAQVRGIEQFQEALENGEYVEMEGACGTGKTLIGLAGGVDFARNIEGSDYKNREKRILAVTSVKQQLKQFITEAQDINRSLSGTGERMIRTVVLRGRADLIPYLHLRDADLEGIELTTGDIDIDEYRETAADLVKENSSVPLEWANTDITPTESALARERPNVETLDIEESTPEEIEEMEEIADSPYNPYRLKAVLQLAEKADRGQQRLSLNGIDSPFPVQPLKIGSVKQADAEYVESDDKRFDPFYLKYLLYKEVEPKFPTGFSDATDGVFTRDEIVTHSIKHGICPHKMMGQLMGTADLCIGNYNHIFDHETRYLTKEARDILDDDTIAIIDEAHNIEENLRDTLSSEIASTTINRARTDIEIVTAILEENLNHDSIPPEMKESINGKQDIAGIQQLFTELSGLSDINAEYAELNPSDSLTKAIEDLKQVRQIIETVHDSLFELADEKFQEAFDDEYKYKYRGNQGSQPAYQCIRQAANGTPELNLDIDDPKARQKDELTRTLEEEHDDIWQKVNYYTTQAGKAFAEINEDEDTFEDVSREEMCTSVGRTIFHWGTVSRTKYFRELVLEPKDALTTSNKDYDWSQFWEPKFNLFNCIPREHIATALSQLYGGLLMSATLEPLDIFAHTAGIDSLTPVDTAPVYTRTTPSINHIKEAGSRGYRTEQYGLRFPEENRESFIVPATRYTYRNRGSPTQNRDEMETTRQQYADLIQTIAGSHGNVLICMPSYGEAKWIGQYLKSSPLDKQIFIDQSSSSQETTKNLNRFFGTDNGSVMVTSTRGTITEGVDYKGDVLHTCVVVGVPLVRVTERQKAIEYAYDQNIDGISGREATGQIPAVRKARQAFGRVIRSDTDVGVRILLDERYNGRLNEYLSADEQEEFTRASERSDHLEEQLEQFWNRHTNV